MYYAIFLLPQIHSKGVKTIPGNPIFQMMVLKKEAEKLIYAILFLNRYLSSTLRM